MYGIVEQLARQITEMELYRIGRRLDFVDEVDEGGFGVGFETSRDGCDVDQIVGLQDNQLRQTHQSSFVHTDAHEVKYGAAPENVLQIGPVLFVVAVEVLVSLAVADLQCCPVFLLRSPDMVLVQRSATTRSTFSSNFPQVFSLSAMGKCLVRLWGMSVFPQR